MWCFWSNLRLKDSPTNQTKLNTYYSNPQSDVHSGWHSYDWFRHYYDWQVAALLPPCERHILPTSTIYRDTPLTYTLSRGVRLCEVRPCLYSACLGLNPGPAFAKTCQITCVWGAIGSSPCVEWRPTWHFDPTCLSSGYLSGTGPSRTRTCLYIGTTSFLWHYGRS